SAPGRAAFRVVQALSHRSTPRYADALRRGDARAGSPASDQGLTQDLHDATRGPAMHLIAILASPALPWFASVLLLAAACVGHLCLVLASHNRWYGSELSKRTVHWIQGAHALVLFGAPVLLVWLAGWDLAFVFDGPHSPWKWALLAYVVTCWSAA